MKFVISAFVLLLSLTINVYGLDIEVSRHVIVVSAELDIHKRNIIVRVETNGDDSSKFDLDFKDCLTEESIDRNQCLVNLVMLSRASGIQPALGIRAIIFPLSEHITEPSIRGMKIFIQGNSPGSNLPSKRRVFLPLNPRYYNAS